MITESYGIYYIHILQVYNGVGVYVNIQEDAVLTLKTSIIH